MKRTKTPEDAETAIAEAVDAPVRHWRHSQGVGGCAWGFIGQYSDGGFPEHLRAIDLFLQDNPEVRMVSWLTNEQANDMIERRHIPDGSTR